CPDQRGLHAGRGARLPRHDERRPASSAFARAATPAPAVAAERVEGLAAAVEEDAAVVRRANGDGSGGRRAADREAGGEAEEKRECAHASPSRQRPRALRVSAGSSLVFFDGKRLTTDRHSGGRRFRLDPRCLAGETVLGAFAHICAVADPSLAIRFDEPEMQQVRRDALAWWIPLLDRKSVV